MVNQRGDSVKQSVYTADAVILCEIPRAIDRWLSSGRALSDLALIVQEGELGARVIAIARADLGAASGPLLDDAEGFGALVNEAFALAGLNDVPCIVQSREDVSVNLIDATEAREDGARAALALRTSSGIA